MKLVMRNYCTDEFLPGCDYTVVELDDGLLGLLELRGRLFREMQGRDPSLREVQYWDQRPVCINASAALDNAVPGNAGMPFAEWIEKGGGWEVVDSLTVPDSAAVPTDCRAMAVTADGGDAEVGWACNLKNGPEIIRTAGVKLAELTARLAAGRRPSRPGTRSN